MSAGADRRRSPGRADHDPAHRAVWSVGQGVQRQAARTPDRQFRLGLPAVVRAVQEARARLAGQGDHAGAARRHGYPGRVATQRCLPGQAHALGAVGGGLERYSAGQCMAYQTAEPADIAASIASQIGRHVDYRPVATRPAAVRACPKIYHEL